MLCAYAHRLVSLEDAEEIVQEDPADPAACLPLFRVSGGAL